MKDIPHDISKLTAEVHGGILRIENHRARQNPKDIFEVEVDTISYGAGDATPVVVKSSYYNNRVLLVEKIKGSKETLVVHTREGRVFCYRHDSSSAHPLARLINVKSKAGVVGLTRRGIRLIYVIAIENPYRLPIKNSYLTIGDSVKIKKDFPIYRSMPSITRIIRNVFADYIPLGPLLEGEPPINSPIHVSLDLGDELYANHSLTKGSRRYASRPKWYYAPIKQTRRNGYSVSIRRSTYGGLSLVRRQLEPIEETPFFRFIESRPMSFLLYHAAHIARKLSSKVVNIYFEKNANQAEEGTIDIFRRARDTSKSINHFIINKTSKVYEVLKDEPGVVPNFTLRSYWLLYRANNVIATEVPQHMNILRSGNKYVRRAPYTQTFVFLQHGVTYLKAQTNNSSFLKGREGEPDYMIVGSKKERDVTADMLKIPEERLLITGLPIFDTITHSHINQSSPEVVTIMLTWKPYEEHLKDFTKSTYYQTVVKLYELLQPRVGAENIRIVAHPKFRTMLAGTDLATTIWDGPVSAVLEETKLLITDYSSVCYNVLYQGGATIFYQPDLDFYEQDNGKLIPADDEYVGHRIFNEADLTKLLDKSITKGKVQLSELRTAKHVKNYQAINEYHDGKNCERIYERLKKLGMF